MSEPVIEVLKLTRRFGATTADDKRPSGRGSGSSMVSPHRRTGAGAERGHATNRGSRQTATD